MERIVGVDFDNTIVSYDRLIHDEAVRRGLIRWDVLKSKKEVRDCIRRLPDGENEWQRVQACVYGPRMGEAELIFGIRHFFERCKKDGLKAVIVSHKTVLANFDETGTNLREAALAWMGDQGFFEANGLGLSQEDVYFGSTRLEKIEHIRRLACTHFIDDLEEMFLEATFPAQVHKTLYDPHRQYTALPDVKVVANWQEIYAYFFDADS